MALGYEPVVPPLRTRVEPPRTRGGGILACARAITLRLRGDARPITAAARLASSVSANTAPVCCDCFIGRVPRWDSPWVRCKGTGNYTKCTFTCEKYQRIFCYIHVSAMISVVHRPGLRRPSLRRATRARTGANRARHRAPRRRPDDDAPPFDAGRVSLGAGVRWVAASGCHPCRVPPGARSRSASSRSRVC